MSCHYMKRMQNGLACAIRYSYVTYVPSFYDCVHMLLAIIDVRIKILVTKVRTIVRFEVGLL